MVWEMSDGFCKFGSCSKSTEKLQWNVSGSMLDRRYAHSHQKTPNTNGGDYTTQIGHQYECFRTGTYRSYIYSMCAISQKQYWEKLTYIIDWNLISAIGRLLHKTQYNYIDNNLQRGHQMSLLNFCVKPRMVWSI